MELDVWLQATLVPGSEYHPESGSRTVDVQLPGRDPGEETTTLRLRPRYLVLATGLNGAPQWPTNISNLDDYSGEVVHSSRLKSAQEWHGKRAVIVGACDSAHDIAAELYQNGAAEVTMVQRSRTFVMSSQHGIPALLEGLYEEGGMDTEDADLIFTSLPINILEVMHTKIQEKIAKLDQDLLQSLENVGFKLDPYPAGMLIKYFRQGGGYYIGLWYDPPMMKIISNIGNSYTTGRVLNLGTYPSDAFARKHPMDVFGLDDPLDAFEKHSLDHPDQRHPSDTPPTIHRMVSEPSDGCRNHSA
ncbi:hypothetical protein Pst134EB_016760 [Puccinia striiformis f. sp. tritici]|nr:hypothetical protein Pst134EB_016760 [Puccinia striiformis f. sp. tritici]